MVTALATTEQLGREQLELIKRTIAKGTTDDEFKLFIATSNRLGLSPLAKQIYAIKRGGQMTIQVSIDGFRAIAARTGELDGHDGPYWAGDDGEWVDVWLSDKPPAAAKLVVYRKGSSRPFTGVATLRSYSQGMGQWAKMSDVMLSKCAESLALRKAFPHELGGVYTPEEMAQADGMARNDQAVDAEVVDDAPPKWAIAINEATTIDALKALAPQLKTLGGDSRVRAREMYDARSKELEAV